MKSLRALRRHKARAFLTLLTVAAVGYLIAVVSYTNHLGWTDAAAMIGCVLAALALAWLYFRPRKEGTTPSAHADSGAAAVTTAVLAILTLILTAIHGISPNGPAPTPSSTPSPILAPSKSTSAPLTDSCKSSVSPLFPVIVSNEGPQVQVQELYAAVASDSPDPVNAQEYLDLYGHLAPLNIPHGDSLYMLGTWDHNSQTFYPQHGQRQPGYSKVTFVRGQVVPGAGGCFHLGIKKWGNPGTFGLTQDFFMVLTSPAQSAKLAATAEYQFRTGNSNLPAAGLDTYGTLIAEFKVSTDPYYALNGTGGWTRIMRLPRCRGNGASSARPS